jgi:outer membrane protein assembly factor BamB
MNRAVRATAIVLVLVTATVACAQPGGPAPPDPATLRGDSTQTRKRLAEAEQKLIGGKAADAADDLQRLIDESGDDLITLDGNGKEYRSARWVAHALLAQLPPDVRKAYQDRIDQPAKKLLAQAKQSRDPRPLWQLLDRYFVSRPTDEALQLLGELLFERGEFRAAEGAWRRLLPDAGADISYRDSKADPALVRARIVLAVIFQADAARAKAEVEAFKLRHPNANGTLAGKTGPLADVLHAFLAAPPKLAPDATGGAAWPTYGGAPDRSGRLPGGIPSAWPSQPTWKQFEATETQPIAQPSAVLPPARPPFGHPVIVNGEIFVSDGVRVFGFDLHTGQFTRKYTPVVNGARPLDPICTLTAADGLLYVRLGPSVVRPPELNPKVKPAPESTIACVSTATAGKLLERWSIAPPEDERAATAWEGAPLVSGRRLWAVYAKFEGGRTVHVAACYDPADANRAPGRPAWTTELCDSPLPVTGDRNRQELLTLAGRHVVFCSNNGAVVALDAISGRRSWGFRYPRTKKVPAGLSGDPSPAVAFGGRVYVAPADGERVYALDTETGRLVWESGLTEGARILGIARGRLVVTVAGPVRGIRGLNLDTGSYRDGGWEQSGPSIPLSYGQGFVTDDVIVWPSREGLVFLDARDGRLAPGSPNPLRGPQGERYFGNLAYADGVLVVVTATQVRGYVAQSRKIEHRPDLSPRERFDAFTDRAEAEVAAGNPARARAILAQIVGSDLPAPFRAWAAARMLQLAPPATELTRLPVEVRDALRAPLLAEWVISSDGIPVTLETLLQRHLGGSPAPGSLPTCGAGSAPCVPALTAESDIDHTLKLPPAVSPLVPIPGGACPPKRLFAAGARIVVAVPLDQRAHTEHAPADLFTYAAELRNWFVAAGPHAVALYGTARDPLWVFRVPTTDPLPGAAERVRIRCGCEPTTPHLSSFVMAGPWLLARIGEHHLLALDLPARRVAWVLSTSGRGSYEPSHFPNTVRFGPHVAVCGKFAVAQLSDGRRWFVELHSGRPVVLPALGEHTARTNWPHAPLTLDANRLLIADGPGLVRLLQLGGRVRWAFEPDRDDGLTGEPAQVWARGDVVLVAVRRNHGVEIERADANSGRSAWTGPAFADADRVDLSSADADADRAYIPVANKLLALALTNGKLAWEVELPDARSSRGWVVRAGKSCVIAYPAEAIPAEPLRAVFDRLARSFAREPFVWRLPGLATTLYDAWVARAVPVLLFDPETGKQLGRFDVPARGPTVTAWFDADRAVIATGERVVWLK